MFLKWKSEIFYSEKEKVAYIEVAGICGQKESSICKIVKKEKEIHAHFAVLLQTAKLKSIVCALGKAHSTGHLKTFSNIKGN
jgi:hypothetical protein